MNFQNQSGTRPFWIRALNVSTVVLAVALGGMAICLFLLQIRPLEPSEEEGESSVTSEYSMVSEVVSSESFVKVESSE
ncbi:MAG: hypothetical protein ACLU5C_10610 [Acutalibacter sp.]